MHSNVLAPNEDAGVLLDEHLEVAFSAIYLLDQIFELVGLFLQ
jgi:hypothetical protein